MTNKTGVATAVFDNRTYQGTPSKFPSWKVMIGNEEFVAYTNNDIGVKQGDNVSFDYGVSKKTGKPYIESDYTTKKPKIQVIPQGSSVPTEEIPIDDDLRNYEPDHFASNGVVEKPSDFNYGANVAKPVDKKSMQIFSIAMAKSALESNQLKADRQSIQNFIKEMKTVFESEF
jgi:hypothetical protein